MLATYGHLPEFDSFQLIFGAATVDVGGTFSMRMNATDNRLFTQFGLARHASNKSAAGNDYWTYDAKGLYSVLQSLVRWHETGATELTREWSGDLASSILQSLGVEWI